MATVYSVVQERKRLGAFIVPVTFIFIEEGEYMYIKKAKSLDKQLAVELMVETATWLNQKGSSQWEDVLNGNDRHGLGDAVEKGNVYFYYDHKDNLVGMFAAWSTPSEWDQLLWNTANKTNKAVYIHRLIIRPNYRGYDYGKTILEDIKSYFKKEFDELRLDCLASNIYLNNFYQKNGFQQIEIAKNNEGIPFRLMVFKLNNAN